MKEEFFATVYNGNPNSVNKALKDGQALNEFDEWTGMQALHIATGRDNLPLIRLLVEEWNAAFGPDREGRWPSLIAAVCEVSDETSDYVLEAEAKKLRSETGFAKKASLAGHVPAFVLWEAQLSRNPSLLLHSIRQR